MQEAHNIDTALVKDMSSRMNQQAPVQPAAEVAAPINAEAKPIENVPHGTIQHQDSTETAQLEATSAQPESVPDVSQEPVKAAESQSIDEYGNPIAKPKMYTEAELNNIINDKMAQSRITLKQQQLQQQSQQVAKDFTPDPNSEETWEVQLEGFIEKTLEKRQAKLSEQQWREQEAQKQAEFESRFSAGMRKYEDFQQVVQPMVQQGKVTDSMMLAARGLENPAAFVYGASKLHPQELERIARISDPYTQAAEVGRLHEKMVRSKNVASAAPRPLDTPRGDMPSKVINMPSLEERIAQHGAQRQARR